MYPRHLLSIQALNLAPLSLGEIPMKKQILCVAATLAFAASALAQTSSTTPTTGTAGQSTDNSATQSTDRTTKGKHSRHNNTSNDTSSTASNSASGKQTTMVGCIDQQDGKTVLRTARSTQPIELTGSQDFSTWVGRQVRVRGS